MVNRKAFVMCDDSATSDDIFNDAREALARAGFQVGDLVIQSRVNVGIESGDEAIVLVETTAYKGILAHFHGIDIEIA
jgi:hypothetical protein